jgi:ubiquinone/menaquinone biosynthesis C-methylase UbiE
MPAAYDNYDYPSYWKSRNYEHLSEFMAIKGLLTKIPQISKSIEIGAGYGRLVSSYLFRVKKALLTDPSARLISLSMKKYGNNKQSLAGKAGKKVEFLQSTLENLKDKIKLKNFDLAIMVRVLHHIEDIDNAFEIINSLLTKGGYLILEFPNKSHLKANVRHFLKGDLTYPLNIFPIDLRSKKHIKKNTLPFINYHPDQVMEKLKTAGFEIIEIRSVSNIRSTLLKRLFPIHTLLDIEKSLQIPMAKLFFGPSFFVLVKKIG